MDASIIIMKYDNVCIKGQLQSFDHPLLSYGTCNGKIRTERKQNN